MLRNLSLFAAGCIVLLSGCSGGSAPPAPLEEEVRPEPVVSRFVNDMPAWKSYRRYARDGEFDKALPKLKELKRRIGRSNWKPFVAEVLPGGRARIVYVYRACDACKDGLCTDCDGSQKCPACKGELTCNKCGGRGEFNAACDFCICKNCNGTGFCTACYGKKTEQCGACKGAKGFTKTRSIDCKRCKASGEITLQGMTGTTTQKCPACGGRKKFPEKYRVACDDCSGRGFVNCKTCSGSTLCLECEGRKRMAGCEHCAGQAVISSTCPKCKGSRDCTDCKNWGKCMTCEASGYCHQCAGDMVLSEFSFLADTSWLKHKSGCVFEDASKFTVGRSTKIPEADGAVGAIRMTDLEDLRRNGAEVTLEARSKSSLICVSETESTAWLKEQLLD